VSRSECVDEAFIPAKVERSESIVGDEMRCRTTSAWPARIASVGPTSLFNAHNVGELEVPALAQERARARGSR